MIFSRLVQKCGFTFFLLFTSVAYPQNFILPNAYAHNDYKHKRPLYDAMDNGFTYVEADIFLRGDKLIVAHFLPSLRKKKTLEELYLKPLQDYVEGKYNNEQPGDCPITLMIDIKSDANKTYIALVSLLEKYRSILSSYEQGRANLRKVTVVITGHRPYDLIRQTDNRLVFIDEDLKQAVRDSSNNIYPIASCNYFSLLKWKGKGTIPDKEKQYLEYYVTQAHLRGRKVRVWASPENKSVWNELLRCNVDLINTNKLKALRKFLVADFLSVAKKG